MRHCRFDIEHFDSVIEFPNPENKMIFFVI
jgi:hypothetical protein